MRARAVRVLARAGVAGPAAQTISFVVMQTAWRWSAAFLAIGQAFDLIYSTFSFILNKMSFFLTEIVDRG